MSAKDLLHMSYRRVMIELTVIPHCTTIDAGGMREFVFTDRSLLRVDDMNERIVHADLLQDGQDVRMYPQRKKMVA